MNKYVKLILAMAITAGYFLILRYVAPSREPYFVLGIGLIGYMAWLYGTVAGLSMALLLVPTTLYIYSQFDVSTSYLGFANSPAYIALKVFSAVAIGHLRNQTIKLSKQTTSLTRANESLQTALARVQEFGGIHSLCSICKNILDDDGNWQKIDAYLKKKTKAEFSHGICPDCAHEYKNNSMESSGESRIQT
ncbi:MAG: hypothetical protein IMF03_07125 [Proteobacteria bacterium]|nr:hypothetical protein [Pseudomonadota bacterium]